MKRFLALVLALVLVLGSFSGCGKEPAETQPVTEPAVIEPGLELEENGVVYESLAQKAVVKTALAYLARGSRIQYDDTQLTGAGTPVLCRWQHGVRTHPESYTSQATGYTNCAAFTYDVYLSSLNMKIDGYTTEDLTSVTDKQQIFSYCPNGTETNEQMEQVRANFMSKLKSGDLIVVCYHDGQEQNGHAMLYVGKDVLKNVEGAQENADIIHSTGGGYRYTDRAETYEESGAVQTMSAASLFDPEGSMYVFGKLKSIVILRPLEVFNKEIPENTLNRMRNMDNVVAEKLSSHPTGHTANPGDRINYLFSVTNKNDKEVTVVIEDTVPALATLESADKTEDCSFEGDRLYWKLTIPANTTSSLNYSVKVKDDAQVGQSLPGDKATVGGISVPCPDVFVARTLTQQEQMDLNAAVSVLADSRLLRGAELVNAVYSKTLKVEAILPEDFAGIMDSVYPDLGGVYCINTKSPYTDAIAPGLFGGRLVVQRNMAADNVSQYMRLEAIRTHLPYADQLMTGDILMGEFDAEEKTNPVMYLVTGDKMLDLNSGSELEYKEVQECLDPMLSYKRFVILRPTMLLDNQE